MTAYIQPGDASDASEIVALLRQVARRFPYMGDYDLFPTDEQMRILLTAPAERVVTCTAKDEAGLSAYAQALGGQCASTHHVAMITIAVAERARRRGLGLRMLESLERLAQDHGFRFLRASVWEGNAASELLFIKGGYARYARIPGQFRDRKTGRTAAELIYGRSLLAKAPAVDSDITCLPSVQ